MARKFGVAPIVVDPVEWVRVGCGTDERVGAGGVQWDLFVECSVVWVVDGVGGEH